MTREEAKDLLDNLIGFIEDNHGSDYDEALKIAIKVLEREPCEDAISRQAVIDIIEDDKQDGCYSCFEDAEEFEQKVREIPSVTKADEAESEE